MTYDEVLIFDPETKKIGEFTVGETILKTSTDIELIKKVNVIYNRLHNYHCYFNFNALIINNEYYFSKIKSNQSFLDSRYLVSSIMTRLESILKYYFQLYRDNAMYFQSAKNDYFNNIFTDYNNVHSNWYKDLQFNSEVILQHLISLFDYFANLFLFTFKGSHRMKGKWKSRNELNIAKCCELYNKCENIQRDYLDRLAGLRSQVFHEGLLGLKVSSGKSLNKISIEKNLFAGDKFKKLLIKSNFIEFNNDVSIFNAFNLLITRVLNDVIELLEQMKVDIQTDLKNNYKEKPDINRPQLLFGDNMKTVLDLVKHFWHFDPYFWNNKERFKNLEYMNRKFNENLFPLMKLPEQL